MNRIAALALVASAAWTTAGVAEGAPPWVSWDAASKTVTFTLEAGAPASNGPFNFDGYSNGAATLVVPAGSTVVMNFINQGGSGRPNAQPDHGLIGSESPELVQWQRPRRIGSTV